MLRVALAVVACLCLACSAEPYKLRAYTQNPKDTNSVLATIEERLRVLDTIRETQLKQARRLDAIHDKLDHVENTLTLKLERVQLATERLEHRLDMLQTNVQMSIKESSEKLEHSQMKIVELTRNLTSSIIIHKHLLEKVNGAYVDVWHRGLVLESLMRDGLSLVNVTRRELADGLKSLARRQRDGRVNTADLETVFTKRLKENANKIDSKVEELIKTQKQFLDSCQQVQQDDPQPVADVLDRLIDSLIEMKSSIFHELRKIQESFIGHDNRVIKILNTQADATCRRLETAFRNTSHTILKENELRQLTEKFVSLTDRADAALLRLEAKLKSEAEEPLPDSEVTAEADRLLQKLEGYGHESASESKEYYDLGDNDSGYFGDGGGGGDDIMGEDKYLLLDGSKKKTTTTTVRPPHRRHLHKHPYDRGPNL